MGLDWPRMQVGLLDAVSQSGPAEAFQARRITVAGSPFPMNITAVVPPLM